MRQNGGKMFIFSRTKKTLLIALLVLFTVTVLCAGSALFAHGTVFANGNRVPNSPFTLTFHDGTPTGGETFHLRTNINGSWELWVTQAGAGRLSRYTWVTKASTDSNFQIYHGRVRTVLNTHSNRNPLNLYMRRFLRCDSVIAEPTPPCFQ
jgi:hypothetical protein